jgi:hypothetical protein
MRCTLKNNISNTSKSILIKMINYNYFINVIINISFRLKITLCLEKREDYGL